MREWHRFQCEVRHVLKLRASGKNQSEHYLGLVEKARGKAARQLLEDEARTQWGKGNRGAYGDWKA